MNRSEVARAAWLIQKLRRVQTQRRARFLWNYRPALHRRLNEDEAKILDELDQLMGSEQVDANEQP